MNANLPIDAARYGNKRREGLILRVRQFEAWLSEPVIKISVNPTFEFVLVQDEQEK